jgi:AcrR family transcriptional regulator
MSKGFSTKETILKAAFELTSRFGLESLSIGELAKHVGMSKSGLFGHFKSKETLQIMVMDYASENFVLKVIKPALSAKRGIARLEKMMANWKRWSSSYLPGGCPFLSAIVEFDDRPGEVRDHIKSLQAQMIGTFEKAIAIAIEEGELASKTDYKQVAYEVYANMIGFHIYNRLLKDKQSEQRFEMLFKDIVQRHSA